MVKEKEDTNTEERGIPVDPPAPPPPNPGDD